MSQRTTLAIAKSSSSRLDVAWNIPASSQRFVDILNIAQRRLLMRGKYWGTYARWTVALTSQWLALPPYIDTIEKIAEANCPLTLRGIWYEFNSNGWGTRDTSTPYFGVNDCIYRGNFPTIADIITPGTLTLKCDLASDATKTVLVLGYDSNGNWVRTSQGGNILDGEVVALSQAGTVSVTQFGQIVGIQAPTNLDGQWWMYQGGLTGQLLGQYQYWDTSPSWKRYLLPFIQGVTTSVEVAGKKAFVPAVKDTDYLVVGNLDALKLAGMAVISEEAHNWSEATLLWTGDPNTGRPGAITELENELRHHLGDGEAPSLEIKGSNPGATDPVPTLI